MNLDAALSLLPGYRPLVAQSSMDPDEATGHALAARELARMCVGKSIGVESVTTWALDAQAYVTMAEYFEQRARPFVA